MFKLNYRQIFNFSFPKALVRYRNNEWFREKLFIWTGPSVTRDTACLAFVVSFCFIKHSSSHFLILYVILSFSIYYYWVRFQQLKYTEPLHSKLQTVFELSFDIRYLNILVPLSTFFSGFFAYICTLGVYLFYTTKSILLMSEPTALSSGPWIDSVKTSAAGFFPISMTTLIHLQCLVDPSEYQKKLGIPENSLNFGKYLSFAYLFDNMGAAPFFGRFTNDLELLKLLENFPFEKFSLFQFFIFTYRAAFRLWIPLFSAGYQNLVWWIHPYSEVSLINLLGQPRYIFEAFNFAVCLLLENCGQQIYASFYMDRWFLPFYEYLNQNSGPKSTKFSTFFLVLVSYILKYAPVYVPCEQNRFRIGKKIADILYSPFLWIFKVFLFISAIAGFWTYDFLRYFISFLVINYQNNFLFTGIWIGFNPAVIFSPF